VGPMVWIPVGNNFISTNLLSLSLFLLWVLLIIKIDSLLYYDFSLGQLSRPPRSPIGSHLFDCPVENVNIYDITNVSSSWAIMRCEGRATC